MRRLCLGLALLAIALSGCAVPVELGARHAPTCKTEGITGGSPLILMAQAVPTASFLPCIELLPTGWRYENALEIRSGRASFALASDRAGPRAVEVLLTADCDIGQGTAVPSEELGMRRYELVQAVRGGYEGARFYRFDGGCVVYQFHLGGEGRAVVVNEASLALGFVSRSRLDVELRDRTGLRLNPPPTR